MKKRIVTILALVILMTGNMFYNVTAADSETVSQKIKVLGIGNSFTVDATVYLREIAVADGVDLEVTSMQIGGSTLEMHWTNAQSNEALYAYAKYYGNDMRTFYSNVDLRSVILSDNWDYIVVQQVSHFSGMYETYQPYLNNFVAYLRNLSPASEILLQQTWAYETNSNHSGFSNYGRNQITMYNALINAYSQASEAVGARLIPSGNAVQNARAYPLYDFANGGMSLLRDGFHMSYNHGRVLVASAWYQALTGKSILDNPYTHTAISENEHIIIRQAVHDAVVLYNKYKSSGLTIKKQPDRLEYFIDEQVSAAGGEIIIDYEEGDSRDILLSGNMLSYDFSQTGENQVTIQYSGQQAQYSVYVYSKEQVNSLNNDILLINSSTTKEKIQDLLTRYNSMSDFEKAAIINSDLLFKDYIDNNNPLPIETPDIPAPSDGCNSNAKGGLLSIGALIVLIKIKVLKVKQSKNYV